MILSEAQNKIINYPLKHLLVIAGAGSGKTAVLIRRIQKLRNEHDQIQILAVTFTRKAQHQMKERLKDPFVDVYTFDALFYQYHADQEKIFILEESPFNQTDVLKINLYDIQQKHTYKPRYYDDYQNYKKTHQMVDFNDLTKRYIRLLNENSVKFYDIVFVDEFQDLNKIQLDVILTMIRKGSVIFAVGDPDQSIYGFRGSYPSVLADFINHTHADILYLNQNYRSTANIINYANKQISQNQRIFNKVLEGVIQENGLVAIHKIKNHDELYQIIKADYEKSLYKSYAILYRTHRVGYDIRQKIRQDHLRIETLTIHEAKGLEFDCIYLIGVDEGIFPSPKQNNLTAYEEERRLLYVAITRAKKCLYLFHGKNKSKFLKGFGYHNKNIK